MQTKTSGRRVLRPRTVAERLDISTSTLWQWVKTDETFPKFFKLGPGSSVIWADELEEWIANRARAPQSEKPAAGPGRPRKGSAVSPKGAIEPRPKAPASAPLAAA